MRIDSLSLWACPRDGHFPLTLSAPEAPAADIRAGALTCPRCGSAYPIRDGIPDFLLLEEDESGRIKRMELESREQELDWPTEFQQVYESRVEAEAVLARLQLSPHDLMLDAGCGFGRITRRALDTGAEVVAADFSFARLRTLRTHTGPGDRVELAVADANHLPLRPATFTKILSTQVLEHLPAPDLRRAFVRKLLELLKPGGALVLTAYNFDEAKRRRGEPAEGYHNSGVFYHCYNAAELRADLQDFEVKEITGIRHYMRGMYKLRRSGRVGYAVDHLLEKMPALSLRFGSLLLAHAVKPQ
jgi:SAM-dependent methyltransferase